MDVSLVQGSTTVVLNGTGAAAPLKAGRLDMGELGKPVIDCTLDGTAAQIASYQGSLEKALGLGELYAGLPGEDWCYLQVTLPDATTWRTPVLSGLCEAKPGPGARASGTQGLTLRLVTEKWWESTTLTDCPLSNRFGTNVTGGLQVDNHYDSGPHNNYVGIGNTTVLGDVPAPAVLALSATPNGLEYFVGQAVTNGVATYTGVLEGESMSVNYWTNTGTADAACSGGNYAACSWSGTGQTGGAWTASGAMSAEWTGRIYRPVMRLRSLVTAGEKIYAWFKLSFLGAGADVMMECEGVVLPTDRYLVVFPPVALPPWPKPPAGFAWEAWHPQIVCQAEAAGAHALAIDFVQMLPTEGWLRFYAVLANKTNTLIRYDGGSGQISRTTTGGATHVAEGPGIMLYPGVQQKLYVLCQNASMDISTLSTVQVMYRARKRVL